PENTYEIYFNNNRTKDISNINSINSPYSRGHILYIKYLNEYGLDFKYLKQFINENWRQLLKN
ncbi:MAG: hypothetical protein V1824_00510, partial [archaeon]